MRKTSDEARARMSAAAFRRHANASAADRAARAAAISAKLSMRPRGGLLDELRPPPPYRNALISKAVRWQPVYLDAEPGGIIPVSESELAEITAWVDTADHGEHLVAEISPDQVILRGYQKLRSERIGDGGFPQGVASIGGRPARTETARVHFISSSSSLTVYVVKPVNVLTIGGFTAEEAKEIEERSWKGRTEDSPEREPRKDASGKIRRGRGRPKGSKNKPKPTA